MKKILNIIYAVILIIALSYDLNAGAYYVGDGASGTGNGDSWTNKDNISDNYWSGLSVGDTVFIDGGADSVVYNTTKWIAPNKSGISAQHIIITVGANSPDPSGHDGYVVFDAGSPNSSTAIDMSSNKNYITIEGLHNGEQWWKIRNCGIGVNIENDAVGITVSGLYITDYIGQGAIRINGNSRTSIDSTIIRYIKAISIDLYESQSDGMYTQRCQRTLVHDCYFRQRNQDPLAHNDCHQAYITNGWVTYNNTFINDSVYSPEGGGTPMIFGDEGNYNTLVYNNFLYMGGIWDPGGSQNACYWSREYNDEDKNDWILFNTIVVNGPRCRGSMIEFTTWFYGNIIAEFSTTSQMSAIEENFDHSPNTVLVDSIKTNLFYSNGDPSFAGSFTGNSNSSNGPSWTTFTTTLGGSTNITGDPLFDMNIGYEPDQGVLSPSIQSGSPAVDAGWDESTFEAKIDYYNSLGFDGTHPHTGEWALPYTDHFGNPVSNGVRDLGSAEFQQGVTDTTGTTSFASVTDAELSSYHIAYGVVSGIDSTSHVWTTTSDSFAVSYPYTLGLTMQEVENGDTIAISNTTSGSYSTETLSYVVLSGTSRGFSVTTKADPGSPQVEASIGRFGDGKIIRGSDGKIINLKQ